jgi:hypothetical protein
MNRERAIRIAADIVKTKVYALRGGIIELKRIGANEAVKQVAKKRLRHWKKVLKALERTGNGR